MGSSKPGPAGATAVEEFLAQYGERIVMERGLTVPTVAQYVRCARPFVTQFVRRRSLDFTSLDAARVSAFVVRECRRLSVGYARILVTALRSFLRYLHLSGLTASSLTGAVPAVAGWRATGLPRDVDPGTLRRVLDSCDRRTATGRRDYAMLVLLARLGLRRCEVARLTLDDIQWRRGELRVRGKGDQLDSMPLPADVGDALAAFLRRGRPKAACRSLFLCTRGSHGPVSPSVVTAIVRSACTRAGVTPFGPHRLRHTAACQMLRRGTPLAEVALVLRHRSTLTTAIYAKVDRRALRALARPWPRIKAAGRSALRSLAPHWIGGGA